MKTQKCFCLDLLKCSFAPGTCTSDSAKHEESHSKHTPEQDHGIHGKSTSQTKAKECPLGTRCNSGKHVGYTDMCIKNKK
jgi:hypothetical protein